MRQAGKVWHGRGSPVRGITLKPGGPSAPARLSLCPILPDARTGIPETPPARPLPPASSLSLLNRASVLPFQTRPSSSTDQEERTCYFGHVKVFYIKVKMGCNNSKTTASRMSRSFIATHNPHHILHIILKS